jgi:hypothetical protein
VTQNQELQTLDRIRTARFAGAQSRRIVMGIYFYFGYRAKGVVAFQFINT